MREMASAAPAAQNRRTQTMPDSIPSGHHIKVPVTIVERHSCRPSPWREARSRAGDEPGSAGGGGPADRVRPPELLQRPDDTGRHVDLTASYAMPGTGRVGVVQVVPGLAHREDRERPDVGGPALGGPR